MIEHTSPRVSVGLPVYNGMPYISEAVESVLAQTFRDLELVVVDNASTDGTRDVCERYARADSRVRYLRNDENVGAARNYNIAFEAAAGDYFKWLAADDALEPDFLSECVRLLEQDEGLVLACTRSLAIDEAGDVFARLSHDHDLRSARPRDRFRQYVREDVNGGAHPIFGLIRADALRATKLLRPFVFSDYAFVGELVLRGRIAQSPRYLNRLRNHEGSYTARSGRHESAVAGMVGADEARWLDPTNDDPVRLAHWRLLWEYMRQIRRTRESLFGKLSMLGALARHLALGQYRIILLKELMFAGGLGRMYLLGRKAARSMRSARATHRSAES